MIRKAVSKDKKEIYQIWKICFSNDDDGYTDFYFQHEFDPENTWVYTLEQRIVSILDLRPHILSLGNKRIGTYFIVGVATLPNYRHKGYMKELMKAALEYADRRVLVTLIQEYDKGLYEPFGFVPTYDIKQYEFKGKEFPKYGHLNVVEMSDKEALTKLYYRFMSNFQGYFVPGKKHFESLEKQLTYERGHLFSYYHREQLQGYYVGYLEGSELKITEIMYDDGEALARMLAHASSLALNIKLKVPKLEKLEILLPNAKITTRNETLVRINDMALFKRCYNLENRSVDSLWQDKPLYLPDEA